VGIHRETPLNINLNISNERRYSVGILIGMGRVNEGEEGEGIWLIDFIYLYELE
jgi:hypothetical protein